VDFNHALSIDEHFAQAIGNRGETYSEMGEYEKALIDYNNAIDFDKDSASHWYNLKGLVLSYLKRYEEAIEAYKQSLEEKDTNHIPLYNIAVAITRWQGLTNAQPYIKAARSALLSLQDPDSRSEAQYGLSGLGAIANNRSEALYYLRKAISSSEHVIQWARHDIAWLDLRTDPQFQDLISLRNRTKRKRIKSARNRHR